MKATDVRLLLTVTVAQIVVSIALRVVSPLTLRRAASRARRIAQSAAHDREERIIWAIEATGRRLGPVSTCLVRAFVAELLLGSHTRRLRLTVGVKRSAGGRFESHAWLADKDRVVIGATSDEFVPLLQWDTPTA